MPEQNQTIKAKEVAKLLGLSVCTVYQNARKGKIPCFYPDGPPTEPGERKTIRFRYLEIMEHIRKNSNEY